ncbi:MAG TPA: hypothetical protein VJC39_03520 [Candidatus Nanoarchaeia archaeon]|nr:hypothetical protein [Candidatus Nanoarchaeia archaeon]
MANGNLQPKVREMREQGLTDSLIMEELTSQGFSPDQIHGAIADMEGDSPADSSTEDYSYNQPSYQSASFGPSTSSGDSGGFGGRGKDAGNIYDRIEEITENIIDEKWDQLIAEVRKIIEWKDQIESKQSKLINETAKLKEDFQNLHQGVLGKLETYDARMRDVGTELKAVGKVFKDVIPEFVENVKIFSEATRPMKKKKAEE